MGIIQQLKEELYQIIKRKLLLEKEIKTMDFYINVLKRELDQRLSQPQ